MKTVVLVSTIIEDNNGKILFVIERKEKLRNKLNLPGGHLEFGETVLEGAMREVKEEVNLEVHLKGLVGLYESRNQENHWFHFVFAGSADAEQAKANLEEVMDLEWHTIEELESIEAESLVSPGKLKKVIGDYKANNLVPLNLIQQIEVQS